VFEVLIAARFANLAVPLPPYQFASHRFSAHRLSRATIPIGCISLIASLAMQVGVHPITIRQMFGDRAVKSMARELRCGVVVVADGLGEYLPLLSPNHLVFCAEAAASGTAPRPQKRYPLSRRYRDITLHSRSS
jgi:hypothetical protein